MRTTLNELYEELWMEVRDHKRLARILKVRGITHRTLAMAAGYRSHAYLGKLIRGQESGIDPKAALKIAKFLGEPVDDLFVIRVSSRTGRSGQQVAA